MPVVQNINYVQIAGLIIWALNFFHVGLPANIQSFLATAIPIVIAVLTLFLHNWINPPAANAKLKAKLINLGVDNVRIARAIAPALLALILIPTFLLGGCSSIGQVFGPSANATAVDNVAKAAVIFDAAQSSFLNECGATVRPSFCTATVIADAQKADKLAVAALGTAAAGAEANTTDVTTLGNLISVLVSDVSVFQNVLNGAKAASGRRAIDPTVIIQIAESVITVALQVYTQIVALEQGGGATTAQLDSLVKTADANDVLVQAL